MLRTKHYICKNAQGSRHATQEGLVLYLAHQPGHIDS